MKEYKVTISADAIEDLQDIHSYIAFTLQAKQAARDQLNRIRKAIYDLSAFPLRHKKIEREPWTSTNIHQFPVDNYEIFYIVDEESSVVSVIRVFYSGRDVEHIIQNELDK